MLEVEIGKTGVVLVVHKSLISFHEQNPVYIQKGRTVQSTTRKGEQITSVEGLPFHQSEIIKV